jgi:type II secretory pathway pseudopilin PulG
MKPSESQARKRRAFTIVELLTVMSIIVILIGLLVPALNKVRRFATDVKQRAQLHSMDAAIELFNSEFNGYPPSGALDPVGQNYCGAMKLCEALMGQDLLGFHTNSVFRADGKDATGTTFLYPPSFDALTPQERESSLRARKGPFLGTENANAYRLEDIYGSNVGSFLGIRFVLCDVYERQMQAGKKTGMPILYYKADTANNYHDPNVAAQMLPADSRGNIYNYWDNRALIELGKPWESAGTTSTPHRLADPQRFFKNTKSDRITTTSRPVRAEEFILISAGWDGEYGTADDICNFEWKYRD